MLMVIVGMAVLGVVAVAGIRGTATGRQSQFVLGGALVDAGYSLQDGLERYDFEHDHDITPEQVWAEMRKQNRLAARVRHTFPRTPRHALVAVVVCMDARIDTNELVGDTRHYYYVIRTAGSVMSEREEEMLELAVANGVKVVVLTTHTDCAAEKVAQSQALRARYPSLARAVDERESRVAEFLARPGIADAVSRGTLAVKRVTVDTLHDELAPR
jgi:carbonic anhydrase